LLPKTVENCIIFPGGNIQMDKIRIQIAIEDKETLEEVINNIDLVGKNEIVSIAKSGEDVIKKLDIARPDIVILGAALSMVDTLSVIEKVKKENENIKCIVVGSVSNLMEELFYKKGTSCIMNFPIDYDLLRNRIEKLYKNKKTEEEKNTNELEKGKRIIESIMNIEDKSLEEKIRIELYRVGIIPTLKGYQYASEIIKQRIMNPHILKGFQEDVYPYIAVKFNTKTSIVESAIRNAIKATYMKRPDLYQEYFQSRGAPTTIEFLEEITEKIRMIIKKEEEGLM